MQRYLHAVPCGSIPSFEVVYDCDGASRVERYCEPCANRVFTRNAVFNSNSHFNFIKENRRIYNKNYHLLKTSYDDKNKRIVVNRCDLCSDQLPQTTEDNVNDNLETRMKIIDEIDDSFESDYDKNTYECGPKLLLCDYCQKEHLLPSYS